MDAQKGWTNVAWHLYLNGTLQYQAPPLRKLQHVLVRAHVNNEEAAELSQAVRSLQTADQRDCREGAPIDLLFMAVIGYEILKPRESLNDEAMSYILYTSI